MCLDRSEQNVPEEKDISFGGGPNAGRAPDFLGLDKAAYATADRRTFLLALIGNLAFVWSNNESMFIYLIKALMQTDEAAAVIVFVTLNTARSRIELVERLGRAKVKDKDLLKTLNILIERFNVCTRVRNEFNHCMYGIDDTGVMSHTQSFRIRDIDGLPALERPKPIDEGRIAHLLETIEEMKRINRELWDLVPRLHAHLAALA
jgi:hypothetical protein